MLALEWPLPLIAGTALHRSIEGRLVVLPMGILMAILMYQSTNAALYYAVGLVVYFWALSEGEIVATKAWTLPQRMAPRGKV